MMGIIFRKLYDFYVLKSTWILFAVLGIFYLLRKDWISGVFFIVALFFVGNIGGRLYPDLSSKELVRGNTPSKEEINSMSVERVLREDISLTTLAGQKLSLLLAASSLVILSHFNNLRWYLAVAIEIFLFFLFLVLNYAVIFLIGKSLKKK